MYVSKNEKREKAAQGKIEICRLFRGMKNLDVGSDFVDEHAGGTEMAPMSTTTDLAVAVHYGVGPESLLFVLTINNYVQMGADVSWLSAFPAEAEVVFPPLTYLQPTGRTEIIKYGSYKFKVVEVQPHIS